MNTNRNDSPTDTQNRVEELRSRLTSELASFRDSDNWKRFLEGMAKTGKVSPMRLSFRNQILVSAQAALWQEKGNAALDISGVATVRGWNQLDRRVRAGEKARIYVLQPRRFTDWKSLKAAEEQGPVSDEQRETFSRMYFRPLALFTLCQTDGADLPASTLPNVETPEGFSFSADVLRQVGQKFDVPSIEFRERRPGEDPNTMGWCSMKTRAVTIITNDQTVADQFATAVHELTHAALHCGPGRTPHGRTHDELEAESVAYIVCTALGLPVKEASFMYLANLAKQEKAEKLLEESGKRITEVACALLDALSGVKRDASSEDDGESQRQDVAAA